jgi:hypothetical protein
MAQDYGILVTQPGTGVDGATLNKETMNTSYPQLKIDTTNLAGFQTLTLSIVTDPPEPAGAGHRYTVIYKYKHGYVYKPAIETLFNITTPPPSTSYSTPYFLDWTALAAKTVDDFAALYAVADDTWVYYIVDKWNGGTGLANLLTGTNINITTHCFLDGVGV